MLGLSRSSIMSSASGIPVFRYQRQRLCSVGCAPSLMHFDSGRVGSDDMVLGVSSQYMPVQADVRFHCSVWDPRHSADECCPLRWRFECSAVFLLQNPCTSSLAQPVCGGRDTGIVVPSCTARSSSTLGRSWNKVQLADVSQATRRNRRSGVKGLKAAKSEIFMIDEVRPDGRAELPDALRFDAGAALLALVLALFLEFRASRCPA